MFSLQEIVPYFIGVFVVIFSLYLYMQNLFLYWTRKKVKIFHPTFPLGNMWPILSKKKQFGDHVRDLYNQTDEPYFGFYILGRSSLVIKNPELIKLVMVKNYQNFDHRGIHIDENGNPFSANMFTLNGEKWKDRRTMMSPAFTSGKLRNMLDTIIQCGETLQKHLEKQAEMESVVEVRDLSTRYTTQVIASSVFGIESNCIMDPDDEFRRISRKISENSFVESIKLQLFFVCSKILIKLKLNHFKTEVVDFLTNIVRQTIEYRENNKVIRNDFMQLLIQLKNTGKIADNFKDLNMENSAKENISITKLASECYLFLIAGFDTSSILISSALYELSMQPNLLRRAQQEIDQQVAKYGGFTYEALMEMKYLDAIQQETARKYPGLTFISRECTKDFKVPDSDLIIEKGTFIIIPAYALQMDSNYFPNPDKFDPERFLEGVTPTWPSSAFMPFGDGPRSCIALKLGKMKVKIALAMMLQKYDFMTCSETPKKIIINPTHVGVTHISGICLKINNRKI